MKSSFRQTPLNKYGLELSPDISRFSSYRIFPTFVDVNAYPVSFLNAFQNTSNPQTVLRQIFSTEYVYNGFSFTLNNCHAKTTVLKKDLTAHSVVTYVPKYAGTVKLFEVDGNGYLFLTLKYGEKGGIVSRTDSFEVELKAPSNKSKVRAENCQIVYKYKNHTYEIGKYLPDFGGRVCL